MFRQMLFADPTSADFLPPLPEAIGHMAQVGDIVVCGNRAGMVYGGAVPSPFYGETEWVVYVGNLPGQRAWSDYWPVDEVEIIKTAMNHNVA